MESLPSTLAWFAPSVQSLIDRKDLTADEVRRFMRDLLAGRVGEAEAAAMLIALRMKGETAEELTAAAEVLRQSMVRLDTGRDDVLDTCGPGGGGDGTFNISTATAIVVAAAGVPVVKHGNRAVTSRTGSADVLCELGVPLERSPEEARATLERAGLVFCFAPLFHPALASVAPLRRRLCVRTIFNLLGPLCNPAGAAYQLLGVPRANLLDPMSGALARLGVRRALVVHGEDGLDEVTLAGVTAVRRVQRGAVTTWQWTPEDFGLEPCSSADLSVANATESADMVTGLLANRPGPARNVVLANAAAALLLTGRAVDLRDGVRQASDAIRTGRAAHVLTELRRPRG